MVRERQSSSPAGGSHKKSRKLSQGLLGKPHGVDDWARATFARKYTDITWTRGPGSNGEDIRVLCAEGRPVEQLRSPGELFTEASLACAQLAIVEPCTVIPRRRSSLPPYLRVQWNAEKIAA